jgi:hypothetical protein
MGPDRGMGPGVGSDLGTGADKGRGGGSNVAGFATAESVSVSNGRDALLPALVCR